MIKDLELKLRSIVAHLKDELATIRTNRPTPKLIEGIKVGYLEQELTVQQLGSISVQPPRQIIVNCWDKNMAGPVAVAITKSGMGITASADGNIVRVNLPALTEERRRELERLIRKMAEESRIAVRAARDEANKKIESDLKAKNISEDEKFKLKDDTQKSIDKYNKEIEDMLNGKISEIHD